jgi:hypothetical protein
LFGIWQGEIWMADDVDAPLDEATRKWNFRAESESPNGLIEGL